MLMKWKYGRHSKLLHLDCSPFYHRLREHASPGQGDALGRLVIVELSLVPSYLQDDLEVLGIRLFLCETVCSQSSACW